MLNIQLFQVKTKPGNTERVDVFLAEGFVAIGWTETGSLEGADKEAIRKRLMELDYEGQSLLTNLGIVNAFVNTMNPDDAVLVTEGEYVHLGILGHYKWKQEYVNERMAHQRTVKWIAKIKKTELNPEVQSLLRNGTSVTKFKHPFHMSGLEKYLKNMIAVPSPNNSVEVEVLKEHSGLVAATLETMKELLNSANESIRLEASKEILRFLKP